MTMTDLRVDVVDVCRWLGGRTTGEVDGPPCLPLSLRFFPPLHLRPVALRLRDAVRLVLKIFHSIKSCQRVSPVFLLCARV